MLLFIFVYLFFYHHIAWIGISIESVIYKISAKIKAITIYEISLKTIGAFSFRLLVTNLDLNRYGVMIYTAMGYTSGLVSSTFV